MVKKNQKEQEMSSYSNLPSYSSGGGSDNAKLMEQMRSQVAVASAQELIQVAMSIAPWSDLWFHILAQKMSDKCFRKCINAPGTELDSREQVGRFKFVNF